MARIVLATSGTVGDHLPVMHLARALARAGHDTLLGVDPWAVDLATTAGLKARPLGPDAPRAGPDLAFDIWRPVPPEVVAAHAARTDLTRRTRDLRAAVEGADLLVATSLEGPAGSVAEVTAVPWVSVAVMPWQFAGPTPPFGVAPEHGRQIRAALGLPGHDPAVAPALTLLASSPRFSTPAVEGVVQTGFWFDPSPGAPLDPALAAFVDGGPSVVLTYSSLPVADPDAFVAVHARAAASLGLRLVVLGGWAELGPEHLPPDLDPAQVFFAAEAPHARLFPRVAAVIHHGGIGTTAQALRAGVPSLIEPRADDQPWNAGRLLALGLGAAMHPHRLTPDGVAKVLERRVLAPATRARARAMRDDLAAEDGLGAACRAIEGLLAALPGA